MNSQPPDQPTDLERREYFRVEDVAQLRYIQIDEPSALAGRIPSEFQDEIGYSLIRELQRIDRDHQQYLRAIAEKNRDLETYLKAINRKIELIVSHLASDNDNGATMQQISLSEGGIGFPSTTPLKLGTYLAIQITLQPSHLTLVLFTRVLECQIATDNSGEPFSVSAGFIGLNEEDRQTIARHIMQVQLAQRRQRYESKI